MISIVLWILLYLVIGFVVTIAWTYMYWAITSQIIEHDTDTVFYSLIWPGIIVIMFLWIIGRAARIIGINLINKTEEKIQHGREKNY